MNFPFLVSKMQIGAGTQRKFLDRLLQARYSSILLTRRAMKNHGSPSLWVLCLNAGWRAGKRHPVVGFRPTSQFLLLLSFLLLWLLTTGLLQWNSHIQRGIPWAQWFCRGAQQCGSNVFSMPMWTSDPSAMFHACLLILSTSHHL